MDAAHHLARQDVPCRDHKLECRKRDADGIGEMAPAAGAKTFRKTMFEIVELDLDGPLGALGLQHVCLVPAPLASCPRFGAGIHVIRGLSRASNHKTLDPGRRDKPGAMTLSR